MSGSSNGQNPPTPDSILLGRVKWFGDSKTGRQYGFIERSDGPDVFFHSRALGNPEYHPKESDRVQFVLQPSRKKEGDFEACDVMPVSWQVACAKWVSLTEVQQASLLETFPANNQRDMAYHFCRIQSPSAVTGIELIWKLQANDPVSMGLLTALLEESSIPYVRVLLWLPAERRTRTWATTSEPRQSGITAHPSLQCIREVVPLLGHEQQRLLLRRLFEDVQLKILA